MKKTKFHFYLSVFIFAFAVSQRASARCEPLSPIQSNCSYYPECLEDHIRCGPSGYALGYGYKYCMRFLSLGTSNAFNKLPLSTPGQQWRDRTLKCLQDQLILNEQNFNTCDAVKQIAFNSHVSCYTNPPSSICDLALNDMKSIARVVDIKEYHDIDGLKQVVNVGAVCLTQWLNELKTAERQKESAQQFMTVQYNIAATQADRSRDPAYLSRYLENADNHIKELKLKIDTFSKQENVNMNYRIEDNNEISF